MGYFTGSKVSKTYPIKSLTMHNSVNSQRTDKLNVSTHYMHASWVHVNKRGGLWLLCGFQGGQLFSRQLTNLHKM